MTGSFLDLVWSCRSSLPGRRSIGCIDSMIASLCGMVCLATCLTGWVNSSWLSFGSVTVSVIVVRLVDVTVGVRGVGINIFVSRTILIIFSLFSRFSQQSALIFIMSWFFTVVTRWFGFVSICIYSIVAHSIYL